MRHRIRKAIPADAELFPEIERSSGELFRSLPELAWIADDTITPAAEHREHIGRGAVWAGEDSGGHVCGFLCAEPIKKELHIWLMAVLYTAQGHGLGRRLINTAVTHAQQCGMAALTLTTFREVPWNAPFYQSAGFCILESTHLDGRLRGLLLEEEAHGMPLEQRCAMRLELNPLS